MSILCLILFLTALALWFFTNESSSLFGIYEPTCVIRRVRFKWLVFIGLLAALPFCGDVSDSVAETFAFGGFDSKSALLVLLLSLVVLMIMRFLGIEGSLVYAVLGSLMAFGVISEKAYSVDPAFILSFIVAPVAAFLLSAVVRFILKIIFSRLKIHMITVSHYMRIVVIACIVLTIVASGFNWGGMLYGVGGMIVNEGPLSACVIGVVAVVMLVFMQSDRSDEEQDFGIYSDFSIYAVVSTGFSVVATLMLFSFESTASLMHLYPVPLSVSSLVISAVAGTEFAQKSRLVETSEYIKEAVALIAVPGFAFVLTYLILRMITGDADDDMADFIVMAASILILIVISFAGYVRNQRVTKSATEKLVYSQQQQIYENARALNAMELKVVISENQALHNAVEMKRQEVMNVALSIVEQREYLQSLNEIVNKLATSTDEKEREGYISDLSNSLRQRLSYDSDVDSQYFYAQAEYLHEDFNAKLSENFPDLTQQERRLATLLRLGFSSKYIASLMNITPKSVEISRYRLRQKLGLSKGDNLVNYIKSI